MVTADEEVQMDYLLEPCFELINSAGKPLTGGYIEVYIHGTRDKYYCFSDWNGTLHPFQIPLDSLGSNIVLASPIHSYDVYVYNKFGSLVMSRYNVRTVGSGSDISVTGFTSVISDGTLDVSVTGNSFIISAQELWDAVSGLIDDVQTVSSALDSVSGMLSGKKDIQVPYGATGSAIQTITSITQDEQGVISVEYGDIEAQNPLTPGQYVSIENDVITVTGLQPEGDYLEQGDLEGYATEQFVTAYVEEHGGDDQVQSDWTETDTSSKAYILHKPPEKQLVAGDHIDITSTASSVEISAEGFATENYVVDYVDSVVSGLDPVDIISSDGTLAVSSTVSGTVKVFDLSVSGGQPVYFRGGETWVPVNGTTADFSNVKKFDGTIVPSDIVSGTVPLAEGLWAWDAIVDIYVGGHVNELVKCGIKGQAIGDGYDPDSETELLIDSTRPGVINSFTLTGLSRGGSNTHLAFTFTRENSSTSTMWVRMRRLSVYQVKGPGVSQPGGGDYEAGYGIIINNNVISVNSALIPDIDTVSGMINNATDGLASESWVTSQGYLTEVPEGYATEGYVTGYVETQIDNAKEIYNVYWNVSTLSEIIQASVLDNKKVYLEVAHYDESWTDEHYEVPLMRLVTPSQDVSEWYAEFVVPYTTADNSPKGIVFKVDATNTWSQYEFGQVQADWSVTATDSVSYIQNKPDLSGFVNESYVTGYVESQVSGLQPAGDYLVPSDLEGYATEDYVTGYVETQVSGLQPAGDYLVPSDLNGYTKEDYVTGYVESQVSGLQPAGDYLVPSDLEGYATSDEVNTVSGVIVSLIPTVEITPTVVSGTKIAEYSIDGVSGELFAPIASGGGSSTVYVDTHTGIKGDGSQADPLAINYDTNTLSTTQGTETVTFTSGAGGYATIPGNSAMATYMSNHTVSITFQGITPVSQYRYPVKLTLSPADGQGGDLGISTSTSIAANDTTCVAMFDIRYDVAQWSTGTWDSTKDWNLWLYFDDEATYPQITYGYATSQAPSDNYKLTVKEPIPSHGYVDANKVLTVNPSNNTLYWNTASSLPSHSSSDAGKVLVAGSDSSTELWGEAEISVVSGSPIVGNGTTRDPLDLNIDTNTLTVNTVSDSDLPMVNSHAQIYADTTLSQYIASNNITFTFTGITPTSSSRAVSFSFVGGSTGNRTCVPQVVSGGTIPANASSFSITVNARVYSEWGYPYSSSYDWYIAISEDDGETWPAIPYTGCSHNGPSTSSNVLAVKNPVPSSTSSDENKVLTVNGSGTPEWQVVASDPVSGGNCISVNSDVVSWITTAGITDIVSVAALPASPVSSVIYLIPEA